MKMEVNITFEMSVTIHQLTWRCIHKTWTFRPPTDS